MKASSVITLVTCLVGSTLAAPSDASKMADPSFTEREMQVLHNMGAQLGETKLGKKYMQLIHNHLASMADTDSMHHMENMKAKDKRSGESKMSTDDRVDKMNTKSEADVEDKLKLLKQMQDMIDDMTKRSMMKRTESGKMTQMEQLEKLKEMKQMIIDMVKKGMDKKGLAKRANEEGNDGMSAMDGDMGDLDDMDMMMKDADMAEIKKKVEGLFAKMSHMHEQAAAIQ